MKEATNQLDIARAAINEIDEEMAHLFERRMQAVEDVIQYKTEHHLPVLDAERERFIIDRNCRFIHNPAYVAYYKEYLQNLMQLSKRYQNTIAHAGSVVYAGREGSFSHIAASTLFPDAPKAARPTFDAVFAAVQNGEAEYGVIPLENSYSGEVGEVLDLLYQSDCYINGSFDLKINHHLVASPGATFSCIKQVYSHPQALSQCQTFLRQHGLEAISYPNTATAAQYISQENDPTKAAIASEETAKLYHLQILYRNINTSADNTTRFIVIQRQLVQTGNRFCLLFTVNHDAGQLAQVMQIIGDMGFNMESIKSRPLRHVPWQYYFYVEIVGDVQAPQAQKLLDAMSKKTQRLKLLGVYTIQ